MDTASWLFFAGTIAAAVALTIRYHPQMPDTMASHFNAFGEPDGWMNKKAFASFTAEMFLLMIAAFAGAFFVLPSMLWLGSATMLLLVSVLRQVFRANLIPEKKLSLIVWLYLLLYLIFTAGWIAFLIRNPHE